MDDDLRKPIRSHHDIEKVSEGAMQAERLGKVTPEGKDVKEG